MNTDLFKEQTLAQVRDTDSERRANTNLISLTLDSGQRQNDHLPSKHFLVEPVAAVLNRRVQIDDLVCDPQFMDDILFGQRKEFRVKLGIISVVEAGVYDISLH